MLRSVGQGARVVQPAAQEDEHPGEHEHGGDVEGVEDRPAEDAAGVEVQRADARHVDLVAVGLLSDALEVQQAEGQGERHEGGEDAPPEHELVGDPAGPRAAPDETLGEQLRADEPWQGPRGWRSCAGGRRPSHAG